MTASLRKSFCRKKHETFPELPCCILTMDISSISSSSQNVSQTNLQAAFKQRSQDMNALQSALQNGDISAAQTAFATVQKNMPTSGQGSQSGPSSQAMQSLQSALQKGDISGAQTAFTSLQSTMKTGHHHQHHHAAAAASSTPSDSSTPSQSSSSSSGGTQFSAQA